MFSGHSSFKEKSGEKTPGITVSVYIMSDSFKTWNHQPETNSIYKRHDCGEQCYHSFRPAAIPAFCYYWWKF